MARPSRKEKAAIFNARTLIKREIMRRCTVQYWGMTLKGHSHLAHMRIRYNFIANLHVTENVICLSSDHQGVHKNSFRNVPAVQDRIEI